MRVEDMLDALRTIGSLTSGLSETQFRADRRTIDAVVRNLEVAGEAARHVPDDLRARFPEIPWQDLADLRNVLTHEYFGVDLGLLWNAVTAELSPLVSALERILASPD